MVQIWGKQKPPKDKKTVNTKDALQKAALTKGQSTTANDNTKKLDPEKIKYMMEAAMLRKRTAYLEQKLVRGQAVYCMLTCNLSTCVYTFSK